MADRLANARIAYQNITNERHKQVMDLYNAGKTSREIAEILHYSQGNVCTIIRKHTGDRTGEHQRNVMTDEIREQIVELYKSGMNVPDIATKLGRKVPTVRDIVYQYRNTENDIKTGNTFFNKPNYGKKDYYLPQNTKFTMRENRDEGLPQIYHWKLVKEHENYAEFRNQYGWIRGFTKGELIILGIMRLRGE